MKELLNQWSFANWVLSDTKSTKVLFDQNNNIITLQSNTLNTADQTVKAKKVQLNNVVKFISCKLWKFTSELNMNKFLLLTGFLCLLCTGFPWLEWRTGSRSSALLSCLFNKKKGEKWHFENQAKPEGERGATWNLTDPVKLGWNFFPCLPKLDLLSFKNEADSEPETTSRRAAHHRSRERKKKKTQRAKRLRNQFGRRVVTCRQSAQDPPDYWSGHSSQAATLKFIPAFGRSRRRA